ncbi:MAG: tetratricopeptide repeat protein, partial [Phycisphaerae bacterium]|nr:tetratricopeptide repeat protein [Phycisphaerae bacterium]
LRELDETSEAIRVMQQALALKPDYVDLHYQLGCLFADRSHFELAVEHFERCSQSNPQNPEFTANLALALEGMGLVDKAAATWQNLQETTTKSHQPGFEPATASRR